MSRVVVKKFSFSASGRWKTPGMGCIRNAGTGADSGGCFLGDALTGEPDEPLRDKSDGIVSCRIYRYVGNVEMEGFNGGPWKWRVRTFATR